MLRTWDYVESYDLTVLRIAALLWMVLVAAGLMLVLWRMLREKRGAWLINANLMTSGALLFAVCFVDLGAMAAEWNVRAWTPITPSCCNRPRISPAARVVKVTASTAVGA